MHDAPRCVPMHVARPSERPPQNTRAPCAVAARSPRTAQDHLPRRLALPDRPWRAAPLAPRPAAASHASRGPSVRSARPPHRQSNAVHLPQLARKWLPLCMQHRAGLGRAPTRLWRPAAWGHCAHPRPVPAPPRPDIHGNSRSQPRSSVIARGKSCPAAPLACPSDAPSSAAPTLVALRH